MVCKRPMVLSTVGHNTLSKLMTKMCMQAKINGFKTNHSLRATAASRLYHQGVDDQLIMERTAMGNVHWMDFAHTNEQVRNSSNKFLHTSRTKLIQLNQHTSSQQTWETSGIQSFTRVHTQSICIIISRPTIH